MSVQPLTLQIPDADYGRLQRRAAQANRTVEAEAVDVLTTSVPPNDDLPVDLAEAIAPLALLDDEALWRAARNWRPEDFSSRAEELHHKRQREGLTAPEAEELAHLVRQYDRHLLIRAQAVAVLHQRGRDVSLLLTRP